MDSSYMYAQGTAMPAIERTLPSTGTVLSAKSTAVTSKGTV
jgi:hypothetical protein